MRENEEQEEREWFAKSKKRIEDLNRKFDNQIVSMIDFYNRRRQEELYRQKRLKEEQEDVTSWQFIRHDITSGVSTFSARNISDPYLLLHHYSAVRKLLTPYFTARFTHPWKVTCTPGYINAILATFRELYDDYNTLSWSLKKSIREEMQAFVQQYGEGALVTFALIHTAYNIRYWRSSSAKYSETYPNKIHSKVYPNLHMSEIPAIAGKEPLQVLTLLKQLNEIMRTIGPYFAVDCASYIHFKSCFDDDGSDDRKDFIKCNAYFHVHDEVKIDLEKREDAQLLITELQKRQD